jgi:hypothetical protein
MKPTKVLLLAGGLVAMLLPLSSARGQVTFPGPELLGRPEPYSITINVVPSAAIQVYFEYGTQSGGESQTSSTAGTAASPLSGAANQPLVAVIGGLNSDTQYYYYMVYRQSSTSAWTTRPEHSFHTARIPGDTFTFTVTSDSHINIEFGNPSLFQQTLRNIASESPDFHLDLGDTFAMDDGCIQPCTNVTTQAQANSSYLNIRTNYFSLISASVPIFLALGNHEQEEGWHLGDAGFAVEPPIMSANARNEYFLNPDPLLSSFYTGNTDTSYSGITSSSDHTIQDYYAWTWGDALFVVIDPYWYSTTKPYVGDEGGGESSTPGSGNRWDWTLGLMQYLWLEQTLQSSTAKYKFIFAHQVAGGLDDYGRGGAYAVPYVEWGGNNDDGVTWAFDTNRTDVNPEWITPVHQLLVTTHVTAFFHGHDHEYAHEQRDGVVYQEVPMAADATYGYGFQEYKADGVYTLTVLPNSGHLRVTVDPINGVTVQYVRASLAAAGGTNGAIADSYNIPAPTTSGSPLVSSLTMNPTTLVGDGSSFSTGTVTLSGPVPSTSSAIQVTLTSSNPSAATVPSQPISIPAGSATGTFAATSQVVTSSAASTSITAAAIGSGSAQAILTVNPVATGLTSLTLNPTSVLGGAANSTSTGTVTLNGSAPTGGTSVALSSNTSAATVPTSVAVPYNTTSNTFKITSNSVTSSTAVTITASLNGSKTATLTVNPVPAFTPVRINSGGPAYTDSQGQPWKADTGYTGGSPYSVTNTISNTSDPTLYKTSRYGASFSYAISAPAGTYSVTLKFAEPVWSAAGKRVFNVTINGTTVLSKFDIFAAAGAEFKAIDETFTVTSSGTITIKFTAGSAGNPLVNAIQVVASP